MRFFPASSAAAAVRYFSFPGKSVEKKKKKLNAASSCVVQYMMSVSREKVRRSQIERDVSLNESEVLE